MGRSFALALVLTATVGLISVGPSSRPEASSPEATAGSAVREVTSGQRKARAKALAKCRKVKSAKKRQACIRRVKKRFGTPSTQPVTPPAGPAAEVLVRDKYFSPVDVEIPKFGSVLWLWGNENADAHNVTLIKGPKGVSPYDFETPLSPSLNYTFKRSFKVPGTYRFACSLHHLMTMTVEVKD